MSNFDRITKSTLFFWSYYSIESVWHNSFKVYKFLKTGVHEKYILISSRGKFSLTSLSKIDTNTINQEFLFWICPVKFSIRHNSCIRKRKCTFIWCSYHFKTPFCVILQYPQLKREILHQKEKQYSVNLGDFFFRILCRMDIYFIGLVIYQSGIRINIINT